MQTFFFSLIVTCDFQLFPATVKWSATGEISCKGIDIVYWNFILIVAGAIIFLHRTGTRVFIYNKVMAS